MVITSREKAIIELIIKTSGKHSVFSIATFLNVSVRTIQRDLKTIEKILREFELHLIRNTNEGLSIEGKNEGIFRLIQQLTDIQPIDQTPNERKLLLLLALFQETSSYKIQILANELGVSIATLTAYLEELTEWLRNYNVQLTRKRGVGVEVNGTEIDKRKALASFFLLYFNEELIESLFLLEKAKLAQDKVLHYFQPEYMLEADRAVHAVVNKGSTKLADSDYIGLIVHICIAMQRTKKGFLLETVGEDSELTGEYDLIKELCKELEQTCAVTFTQSDIEYLAVILKGSKLQAADFIPYDSVVLGRMIKNVIQFVSLQLHIDFSKDFSLYQGLLAHMEPALFRMKQQLELFNPLTEEIKRKYPVLFMAVKNSVEKEFKDMGHFPDDEIAFIVLHFGSALVMREEELSIKALVVCPTGIGTSKMLASRIKKEIIEIDSVDIKSIKDLQQQDSLHEYDVIISTVRLPFISLDYILVTPLLNDGDIVAIREFLKRNIESLTKNKQYRKPKKNEETVKIKSTIQEVLQELKDVHRSIESVIKNLRVYRMPHFLHTQMIEEMVRGAERDGLLSHTSDVIQKLKDRERQGGLGIPNTGMGLFHCRHEKVRELIFQVAHLEQPCLIKGMDGKGMYMKTLLLMLAPEELSVREQEIVSLISVSLIESDEAAIIFSSSNEEIIRSRLEAIFLEYLHTNLIKE
ncbi:BglG family transcription antiterminator [Ectobacillus antri]|jgi:mannitol operon transcriptional antiterminator|uniref:BglG family transcription antiterminator n=1 Tax=Ectobacillus antri TaxID=2486280 RepID=UPI000F596DE8|nr:PRD domain-containing protein [Ectobacillus antri]